MKVASLEKILKKNIKKNYFIERHKIHSNINFKNIRIY